MEQMGALRRTHKNGVLRKENIGEEVVLMGWAQKTRDLGALVFIDLRDKTGITQLVVKQEDEALFQKATSVRQEYVLAAKGTVIERESANPELPTGEIEVMLSDLRILDMAKTPPIYIKDDDNASEQMQLKYRYLDLRKPHMQRMLQLRADVTRSFREFLYQNEFVEVETPILGKPTPEGARDYLVPSRVNDHQFYALPQSPQLMKQLLMISGTERYYQVAKCFRDEDLRADRQPEFTQVDIEMSFVDTEDVIEMNEKLISHVFSTSRNIDIPLPLPRISYADAISKYGSDKPDLRYGFEIRTIDEVAKNIAFPVFQNELQNGGHVVGIKCDQMAEKYSRKGLDKLTTFAKGIGASGLLWMKVEESGVNSSFSKFLDEDSTKALIDAFEAETGDLILIMSGQNDKVYTNMGSVRVQIATEQLTFDKDNYALTWVVDFPMFEFDEEEDRYVASHHPFTCPLDEDVAILESSPEKVRAKAYDIVCNGYEMGGGSIRINNADLQNRVFALLKITPEDIQDRFGFFTEALSYGTPPHGGIAYGLDRVLMLLGGTDNIKDVIAFPKTQSATDLLTEAPATVTRHQLEELHIQLDEK